jgi:hypothetical protein
MRWKINITILFENLRYNFIYEITINNDTVLR